MKWWILGAIVVALSAFGLWALAEGPGTDSATGPVASIERVSKGKRICVASADGRLCGTSYPPQSRVVTTLKVGQCIHIEVARNAALEVERRTCP